MTFLCTLTTPLCHITHLVLNSARHPCFAFCCFLHYIPIKINCEPFPRSPLFIIQASAEQSASANSRDWYASFVPAIMPPRMYSSSSSLPACHSTQFYSEAFPLIKSSPLSLCHSWHSSPWTGKCSHTNLNNILQATTYIHALIRYGWDGVLWYNNSVIIPRRTGTATNNVMAPANSKYLWGSINLILNPCKVCKENWIKFSNNLRWRFLFSTFRMNDFLRLLSSSPNKLFFYSFTRYAKRNHCANK